MVQASFASQKNKPNDDMLTDDLVADYIKSRPDFFQYYPHLLVDMVAPEKRVGDNVSDFQAAMINNLRHQLQESSIIIHELVETSRDNMYAQDQIHKAVLRFMRVNSINDLVAIITQDIARAMDIDAISILIEGEATNNIVNRHIRIVPAGTIDQHIGKNNHQILWENEPGDPDIFGRYSSMILSGVYIRMHIDADHDGLIAFGVQEAGRFSPDLGAELIRFLADSFSHSFTRITQS